VIGGEFLLDDGDVVQKIFSSGLISHLIAWQGNLDTRDYDASRVLEGETEVETIAKVEAFVRGDRSLLIQELTETIAFWQGRLPEYEEKGRTDDYWKRVAAWDRKGINKLEAMLRWAQSKPELKHTPDEPLCAARGSRFGTTGRPVWIPLIDCTPKQQTAWSNKTPAQRN
jgi:hypothetical protein